MRVVRLIGRRAALVIRRPAAMRTVLAHHGPALALAGAALAGPALASLTPFRVLNCMFLRITGYPCPTCGGTRAFIDCLAGDWTAAFREYPMAVPLFFAAWLVFFWNLAALVSRRSVCVLAHRPFKAMAFKWAAGAGAVLLLGTWIYRLVAGLK